MALIDKLSAIGNAIREKTGKEELLTLDAMPGEIRSIQSGGSADTSTIEEGFLNHTYPSGVYRNDQVEKIYDYTFMENYNLTSVSLPNAKRCETGSFYYCGNLEEIDLPNCEYIGSQSFAYCGLKNVYLPKALSLTGSVFVRCEKLETICLPEATSSFQSALNYCISLWKCDFHKMTNIQKIFTGCASLTALILRKEDGICSLTASSNLSGTPIANGTGYIYVPASLIEDYKVATNWATYANQFRAIEDYPDICGEVA